MARTQKALPVKLFLGLRIASPEILKEVSEALAAKYGDIDLSTATFDSVPPPESEGPIYERKFLSFESLIDPGRLSRIKLATDRVERELKPRRKLASPGPVLIEPGYVSSAKVVLGSRRNAVHRVYIGRGVYGEVTLALHDGAFLPNLWAPPDYRQEVAIRFFGDSHQRYLDQIQLA
ncbi:MAG: DUF4416 family protein [Planctomycetota bacterium]|nr:DUF4416 family protein [Planctomycetota bacterium]